MKIGNKIIKYRKINKLSQEQLAEKLSVSRQTISNWELDITKPDVNQIKKLSFLFNVSIDEMLDNDLRDIIEKKVSNTEKISNENNKKIKIIIITLYFLILSFLIVFIIYCCFNKDFTNDYQFEVVCEQENSKIFLELSGELNEAGIYHQYLIKLREKNNEQILSEEVYFAGETFNEAIESMRHIKKTLINNGCKCK